MLGLITSWFIYYSNFIMGVEPCTHLEYCISAFGRFLGYADDESRRSQVDRAKPGADEREFEIGKFDDPGPLYSIGRLYSI